MNLPPKPPPSGSCSDSEPWARVHFLELLEGYSNHQLTDEEFGQLQELMHQHPEARRLFLHRRNLDANLYEMGDTLPWGKAEEELEGEQTSGAAGLSFSHSTNQPLPARALILSLAMMAAGLLIGAFYLGSPDSNEGESNPLEQPGSSGAMLHAGETFVKAAGRVFQEKRVPAVAILASSVEATWADETTVPNVGSALAPGRFILTGGLAQIDFVSGATAVLEGPAEIEIISAMKCVLHQGKVRSQVPPQARGFTIVAAEADFVDLGTDFAVEVSDAGRAELHVFEGEVNAHGGASGSRLVRGGSGLALDGNQNWEVIELQTTRFVDTPAMAELSLLADEVRFLAWKEHRDQLVKHPSLVLYYDFESAENPAGSNILRDRGSGARDGAVVGGHWAEGRWSGKRALDFKRPNDRVRFSVPGDFDALSMVTSIRIDGYDRLFNSIMLTDGFEIGEVHWQVKSTGKLDLGVSPPGGKRILSLTRPLLDFEDLGRWMQLAVVINPQEGKVHHYLDGESVAVFPFVRGSDKGREPVLDPFPLRLGDAQLGNWNPVRPQAKDQLPYPLRSFNGRMDEFMIFSKALTDSEIRDLYRVGRP